MSGENDAAVATERRPGKNDVAIAFDREGRTATQRRLDEIRQVCLVPGHRTDIGQLSGQTGCVRAELKHGENTSWLVWLRE